MISSIVLFLRRAACGVGPAVDAERFGAVDVADVWLVVDEVDAVAAGVEDAALLRPPNRPPLVGAGVDVGAAELEFAADDVPGAPNNPPELGAAGVDDGAALDVVLLEPPKRPPEAGVVDAGLFTFPNKPPDGAGVLPEAAVVEDAVLFPKSPEDGAVLAAEAVAVVELGAADEDCAAPNNPPVDDEVVGVDEAAFAKRPPEDGFVLAAPEKSPLEEGAVLVVVAPPPNSPPDGAAVVGVDDWAAPKRDGAAVVVGVFKAGAAPNSPPDGGAVDAVAPPNRPPDGAVDVFDAPMPPKSPPPVEEDVDCAGLFKFPNIPPLGAAAGVLDAACEDVDAVVFPKLPKEVVAAGFCPPNKPPAAGCVFPPPNNPPPTLFESPGGGPAGVVELPNIGFEAGVVEPAGAALDPPNKFDVAAGLFTLPNKLLPLVDAGVLLDEAAVPKLNVGCDVAAGALVPAVPNNPPLDGAVDEKENPPPEEELDGRPVPPKLPNGFLGASDMLLDVMGVMRPKQR